MTRPEIPNSPAINAHLSHADWWASLTDEQRANVERRRRVFGSLDVAHEMNRSGL